jgi:hypothetical protein
VNDVYDLVRSLRQERWPRNRHFEAHATKAGAMARRLHRFLRAVERDVRVADSVRVVANDEGVTLEMAFLAVRLARAVQLTKDELALLLEDPEIAARLKSAD